MQQAPYEPLYDFPCSPTFRNYENYELTGKLYNDEPIIIEPEPQVIEHIHRHSDMGKKEFGLLMQTSNNVKHLRKQFEEHVKPKAKRPAKPSDYKGLSVE